MLVLLITLVPTISHARSFTSDDSVVIGSQYHDLFNQYFSGKQSYQYFPYECDFSSTYSRTCYFGIDKAGNYLEVNYVRFGSSYETQIISGKEENFSVIGQNIIKKDVSPLYVLEYFLIFVFILVLLLYMMRCFL